MRILIYSHDSFGLGHLRRCRLIAHELVKRYTSLSVLILSGSPIIGSFDFRTRVDFVRIPGVIKLRNGEYTSLSLHIDISETLAMRSSIIQHTAETFNPDLFLVDKEPLGLRGEIKETLEFMKAKNIPTVLGVRDVLDEPSLLLPEWKRKNVIPALRDLYDKIWVYGPKEMNDPFDGLDLSDDIERKISYAGYLRRDIPQTPSEKAERMVDEDTPYILVTTGGGGDGDYLIDLVLRTYESDEKVNYNAFIVLGPFMQSEKRNEFISRAEKLPQVQITTFDSRIEHLISKSVALVGMGGYNTFCEILSFDKPALLVPRKKPRREQFLRISKAEKLGLVKMLDSDLPLTEKQVADALNQLPSQQLPSKAKLPSFLNGLDYVCEWAGDLIEKKRLSLSIKAA